MTEKEAQETKILPLIIDGIFKMYFENPDNSSQLQSFLLAHIEIDQDDLLEIHVLNPGLPKANVDNKGFTVDLLLKTKSGNDIHVEMQTSKEPYFKERVQLYNARTAGQQLKVGQKYHDAKRTISLIIIDFNLFGDYNRYHENLFMRRDNGEIFTKTQEINIVNLQQVDESKCEKQYLWGKLLKAKTAEELEMIANKSEEMKIATEKLFEVSADDMARAYALSEEYRQYQIHMSKVAAKQEAKKREEEAKKREEEATISGLQQGEISKAIEITKKLLSKGMSVEDVADGTGLSVEEVKELNINSK